VVLKGYGEPVVCVPRRGGDRLTVMAEPDGGHWVFTWGRTEKVAVGPEAARHIATAVDR
jgi:hypothetical protein